jgi:GH25 family lysozyme M1 (1,4-beta-N-acetylmuramidase)
MSDQEIVLADISIWNTYPNAAADFNNWDDAFSKIHAFYIKHSEGRYGRDRLCSGYRQIISDKGRPFGLYHFARPQRSPAKDPVYEAENFAAAGLFGELPPMLDLEWNGGSLTKFELQNWIDKFITKFYELTGRHCGAYTRKTFWDPMVDGPPGNTDIPRIIGKGMRPLWVAHHNSQIELPWIPYDWEKRYGSTYTFWQWTCKADAREHGFTGDDDLDLNHYFGKTIAKFNAEFKTSVPELPMVALPTPPPVSTIPELVNITAWRLNLRASPWGTIVTQLPRGLILYIDGSAKDASGKVWYRSGSYYLAGWKDTFCRPYKPAP